MSTRLDKLNKKIKFQENTKTEADARLQETRDKLAKLEAKAQAKGVDINNLNEQDSEMKFELSRDPNLYDRKVKI